MKRIKTKAIKWCDDSLYLREGVKTGIEMSFVSPDNQQCTPFFHCKDYLQDAIFNYIHSSEKEINGFKYNPLVNPPLSMDKTKILFTNSQDFDLSLRIPACLDFLNQFEKEIKTQKTKVFRCSFPARKYLRSGVWLFEGSCRWMKSPPMISLYALMIRLGMNHKEGTRYWDTIYDVIDCKIQPIQDVDTFRIRQSRLGIERIIDEGDRNIFYRDIKDNYPIDFPISAIHNKLGIVSFSQDTSKSLIPYWHRNKS